jgi:hypothetical protein
MAADSKIVPMRDTPTSTGADSMELDYDNLQLTIQFQNGAVSIFNLKECRESIRDRLALHGAIQMAADRANRMDDCESAFEEAEETIAYIYEQFPEKPSIGKPRGLLIKSISRLKNIPEHEVADRWNKLPQETAGAGLGKPRGQV